MIKYTEDRKQIIALWHEVFGDSEEDIVFFLDNCKNKKCLGYFEHGTLVSMLFLIDCTFSGYYGEYIYAVCTTEKCRKKGYASKLINEAKANMKSFLWLIPAKDYLFDFYSKYGFKTKLFSDCLYKENIQFSQCSEIIEYLYEGSDYDLPKGMLYSEINLPCGGTGMIK